MEKKINSELIYDGKIIKVLKDDVIVEKGKGIKSVREVVEHHGGVVGLVLTNDKKIKFVKQYRYAIKDYLLELPAGKLEIGEEPKDAIYRELQEEVGVKANKIDFVGSCYVSPGYCTEMIYMYYVDDYDETDTNFDECEDLDLVELEISEAYELAETGKIIDGKTLCLMMMVKDRVFNK